MINVKLQSKLASRPTFPILRAAVSDGTEMYGQLVVLFTSEKSGVPLSGVSPNRIGKSETWVEFHDVHCWKKCAITIDSED